MAPRIDLSELPVELIPSIVGQVNSRRDLASLQRVCRAFFAPATRRLYSPALGPVGLDSDRLRRFVGGDRAPLYRQVLRDCRVHVTRVVGGKLGIELRFLADFCGSASNIERLSVESRTDYINCSPFSPLPIEEIAGLPRLRSLELVSCGVPLAGLGRARAATLEHLVLIRCLISVEDLAACIAVVQKLRTFVLRDCKLWKRSEAAVGALAAALDAHAGTLEVVEYEPLQVAQDSA
ncbi:hypothetical protein DFJ74DRAFT_23667 [Hyaloraphidium curvatum]|nr:hypothetical protein DFJ74DRAFT_23667 [Hyaloraphidium curvatum]